MKDNFYLQPQCKVPSSSAKSRSKLTYKLTDLFAFLCKQIRQFIYKKWIFVMDNDSILDTIGLRLAIKMLNIKQYVKYVVDYPTKIKQTINPIYPFYDLLRMHTISACEGECESCHFEALPFSWVRKIIHFLWRVTPRADKLFSPSCVHQSGKKLSNFQ